MKDRLVSMSQKKKIIFSVIAVLLVLLIAGYIWKVHFATGYRTIKIYEVNGTASLERENASKMQAYENLVLKDQDLLDVAEESNVRLQMDDDKYALVEQNSVISIKAQGDNENSKTDIILERGTVVTEIRNKLGSSETYKVTTPNAVMAVRGTVFRVEQTNNEEGEEVAKLTVFDGVVSIQTRNSDGSLSEETLIESGQAADVVGQGDEAKLTCYETIDYSQLTSETLEFLRDMIDEQQEELVISRDDLSDLLQDKQSEEVTETQSDATSESVQETSEAQNEDLEEKQGEKTDSDTEDTEESEEEQDSQNKADSDKEQSNHKNKKNNKVSKNKASEKESSDTQKNATKNSSSDKKKSTTKKTTKTNKKVSKATTQAKASDTTTENQNTKVYTVTFTYLDKVFAVQKVKEGSKAKKPLLQPAGSGEWKYDFDTAITADTTIVFE